MMRCTACEVDIEGPGSACPLCGTALDGTPVVSPFPEVPLRFSRARVLRVLFGVSLAVVVGSYGVQLLLGPDGEHFGAARFVWMGIATMWLVVLLAVRSLRSIARGTLRTVILAGLVTAYWDYLTGWNRWSIDYAIPIVSASAIIALMITMRVLRVDTGDHVHYSGATMLLGLAPLVFVLADWTQVALPSIICVCIAAAALLTQFTHARTIRHELARRLHL